MTAHSSNSQIEAAIAVTAPYLKILGGPGTGKTFILARRVETLLASGVNAADIVVVLASANAVEVFKTRLAAAEVSGSDQVNITTIRSLCSTILADEKAIVATGRYPRIINNMENIFLLEDLKALGIKPKRLKEMLKFFYREWTELGDEKEDFLIVSEEELVHRTIKETLAERKAMLDVELSSITARYLRDNDEARTQLQIAHVLVDDYQDLNKASQVVVQLLARETLTIAGNPNQVLSLNEPYPYPQGLDEFSSLPGDLVEIELSQTLRSPQRIVALDNSLLLADFEDASPLVAFESDTPLGEVSLLKWATPDDEIAGIGRFIEQRLGEGDDTLNPEDVFIVVPNGVWGRAFAKQLARLHIKTSSLLSSRLISGNPREEKTSFDMRAYTILNLLADPGDIVAWRSWCGYDDYLANSVQWTRLGELAREDGRGLIETLEQLSQANLPDSPIEDLIDAYRIGQDIIENCGEKKGITLLNALEKNGIRFSKEFEALLAPLSGEETAVQLYSRVSNKVLEPRFPSADAVRIGVAESTQGLEAKLVLFVGMINGFSPSGATFDEMVELSKRDKLRREERLRMYNAAAIASESLVFSYFQKEALERAEPLKMEIKRIKAERGVRMAMLTPSVFFDEMGSSLPGAVTLAS